MMKQLRSIYSRGYITKNLLGNSISYLFREVSTASNPYDENWRYDIIIAGGGMVGTTVACTLG
jgi:hypothetical protein